MVSLKCLGASHEVGRSAFILSTDKNFLLDYGLKVFDLSGEPKYPIAFEEKIDAALISHAHLDHSGYIPHLYTKHENIHWYATPPTRDICELLLKDSMKIMGEKLPYKLSHYHTALKQWHPVFYDKKFHLGDTSFVYKDAGHIVGSSMIEIYYNNQKILYTGDFKTEGTRLHKGAEFVEDVDTLIIEGTYGDKEHPDRAGLEKQLVMEIEETLGQGGHVLMPAFALGRSQEVISIIRSYSKDIPIYLDGMSKEIARIYMKYPYYIKNFGSFEQAIDSVNFVENSNIRKQVTRNPCVIVTTAGMMQGGPVLEYLFNVNPESKVIFTGYSVEGTNGWRLLNHGKIMKDDYELDVSLPVEYLDFSAHASKSELVEFVKKANPKKVVVVHADPAVADSFTNTLKGEGFNAVAPNLEEVIEL